MPTSSSVNTRNILPGMNNPITAGKEKAATPTIPSVTLPATLVAPVNTSRKIRVQEDFDSEYAEEAEDFIYGESI
jgi:hypothetical protein